MTTTVSRLEWLGLYKALQRAGKEFPQYNYRHFAQRRIRDYFEHFRTQRLTEEELANLYKQEGQSALVTIRRQTQISALYPQRPLVIEGMEKNSG